MIVRRKNSGSEDVKVSICALTYNHAQYLDSFFQGILNQKTDFKFELVINDDCSTDGSRDILLDYQSRYPEIITLNLQEQNQYSLGPKDMTKTFCLPLCTGEYMAYCESDDYWIDPLKLQKQVDYLDSHEGCVLVHSDMNVENSCGEIIIKSKWKQLKNYNTIPKDFGDNLLPLILQGKYSITTLTVCLRRAKLLEVYEECKFFEDSNLLMGDTNIWMALSRKGSFYFLPEVTACYRELTESATHSQDFGKIIKFYASCIYMVKMMSSHFSVSAKAKDFAIQEYLYFLLLEIYDERKEYLKEMCDKVPEMSKLNFINTLLVNTIDSNKVVKKIILTLVRIRHKIMHRSKYYCEKVSK